MVQMKNRRLLLQVHTLSLLVEAIVARRLQDLGVAPYLFGLLSYIRENEPVSPSAISAGTGTPTTTLRDNIERLVRKGLVRRKPNPEDGRSYLVVVTPKGEVLARAADPALLEAYLALEQRLERPLADYEAVLDEVADALQGALEEAPATPAR